MSRVIRPRELQKLRGGGVANAEGHTTSYLFVLMVVNRCPLCTRWCFGGGLNLKPVVKSEIWWRQCSVSDLSVTPQLYLLSGLAAQVRAAGSIGFVSPCAR